VLRNAALCEKLRRAESANDIYRILTADSASRAA
jgi:hypothetical protein